MPSSRLGLRTLHAPGCYRPQPFASSAWIWSPTLSYPRTADTNACTDSSSIPSSFNRQPKIELRHRPVRGGVRLGAAPAARPGSSRWRGGGCGVPLAAEQNPTLWRPVSWTAERREAVSPIPGVRASGETLISRRVRETGIGPTGRPSRRCPASLIKWPFRETVGTGDGVWQRFATNWAIVFTDSSHACTEPSSPST